MRVPLPTVRDPQLIWRRLRIDAAQVSFLRGLLDASDGLGAMFAERGGDLLLVSTVGQIDHLNEFVADVCRDLGAILLDSGDQGRAFVPPGEKRSDDERD